MTQVEFPFVEHGIVVSAVFDKYGITPTKASEIVSIGKGAIGNWKSGRKAIPFKHASKLADHYGFCVYEFYPVNEACKGSTITIRKGDGDSEPDFQYKPAKDWPKR